MKQKLDTNTHTLIPAWGKELGQGHLAAGLGPQALGKEPSQPNPGPWGDAKECPTPQGQAPGECRSG